MLLMKSVLFLCTGNSCRSVMVEGLLKHHGKGLFRSFSAGSNPTGRVHPMSLETLRRHGIDHVGFESKAWDVFQGIDFDIVITVCDNAAGETCPIFPGNPVKGCSGPQKLDSRISYYWLSKKGVNMPRKRKSHTAAVKA